MTWNFDFWFCLWYALLIKSYKHTPCIYTCSQLICQSVIHRGICTFYLHLAPIPGRRAGALGPVWGLNFGSTLFFLLWNSGRIPRTSPSSSIKWDWLVTELLWRLNEIIHVNHLLWYMSSRKCSVSISCYTSDTFHLCSSHFQENSRWKVILLFVVIMAR